MIDSIKRIYDDSYDIENVIDRLYDLINDDYLKEDDEELIREIIDILDNLNDSLEDT